MSQNISHTSIQTIQASSPHYKPGSRQSRAQAVLAWLKPRCLNLIKVIRVEKSQANQYQTYIEQNILDPNVGPEISRTLRR